MTFTAKDIRAYQTEVKNNTPRFIREHRATFDKIINTVIKQIQKSVYKNPEAQNCTIDISLLIKSAVGIDPVADSGEFRLALVSELGSLGFTAIFNSYLKTLNHIMVVTWDEKQASSQDDISERLDKIEAAIADLAKSLDISGSESRINTKLGKLNENINDVKDIANGNSRDIGRLDCY